MFYPNFNNLMCLILKVCVCNNSGRLKEMSFFKTSNNFLD